jgi:hypothetical protein
VAKKISNVSLSIVLSVAIGTLRIKASEIKHTQISEKAAYKYQAMLCRAQTLNAVTLRCT